MSYDLEDGDSFRVRYLGSITFTSGKRQGGIDSLQRPLLDLYTTSRRRGETHRSAHPLALTQELDVSSYGLVVAEAEDQQNGESVAVVTKVITPVSNITLWAAVRFHTRIVKRKVFGAAFVPLACSEGAVDQKSYIQLGSKQRFLVSLTHPSLFACLLRRVSAPKSFECHAFVCASAEDALTLSSVLGEIKDRGDHPAVLHRVVGGARYGGAATRSLLSENSFYTGDESPSDITPPAEPGHYTRSYLARSNDDFTAPRQIIQGQSSFSPELQREKFRMYSEDDSPSDITLSKIHANGRSNRPLQMESSANHLGNKGDGSFFQVHRLDTPPSDRRKMASRPFHRKDKKREARAKPKHYTHNAATGFIRHPTSHEMTIQTPKASRWRVSTRTRESVPPPTRSADLGSESELWSERTEERWEPVTNWQSREGVVKKERRSKMYLKNGGGRRAASSTTSGESYLSREGGKQRHLPKTPLSPPSAKKDMATMTEGVWETENSVLSVSDDPRPFPPSKSASAYAAGRNAERRRSERRQSCEELSQTMELSSESEFSTRDGEAWKNRASPQRVKYTYFGYETYSTPTSPDQVRLDGKPARRQISPSRVDHQQHQEVYSIEGRHGRRKMVRNAETQADASTAINSDSMGKIIITVPYQQGSKTSRNGVLSNGRTSHVPHGVRSFHKTGHVKNWSTLSQTSDLSYQGSATLPPPTKTIGRQNKVIRWSSDDRLPRRYGFLASLKRLSLKSLTKAKTKTGRFISNVRTRFREKVKGKKTPEGSEDSAYDTSEVCLSPNGHNSIQHSSPQKTRRRLSWSFHDLRTANGSTMVRRGRLASPPGSALGATSARQLVHKRKHRRRRQHRHPDGSPSSSDSGVEEYHSDYSDTLNSLQKSESEMEHFASEVTQVKVRHGMSKEAFHRWSQTNLQDELGYIP